MIEPQAVKKRLFLNYSRQVTVNSHFKISQNNATLHQISHSQHPVFHLKRKTNQEKYSQLQVLFLLFLTTLKIVPLTLTKASRNVSSSLFRHLNYTSKICVNIREIAVMTERIAIWDLFHTSLILIDLFCAQLLYNYIYFKDETYIMNT